ncbi:MAG: EutN/CcmL family microcompartment protein [Spirochaetota bacterium]
MTLGKVAGTVVSTNKEPLLEGIRFLVVEKVRYPDMSGTGDYLVAMDAVGAGVGELVMVVAGSSSRLTEVTKDRPADATITAIVDEVDLEGATVYRKYG